MPTSLASVSTITGFEKSGYARVKKLINAFFNALKAPSHSIVQSNE